MLPPFLQGAEEEGKKNVIVISPESVEETKHQCCERLLEGIEEKNVDKMKDALDKFFKLSMEDSKKEEKPNILDMLGGKNE